MKRFGRKNLALLMTAVLMFASWSVSDKLRHTLLDSLVSPVEAYLGRPATPVSYAGVARRTTVRVATPGVGAPGVGVRPGVGAGQAGVGYSAGVGGNLGGPVNRVGVR